jgi:hypothetical protein
MSPKNLLGTALCMGGVWLAGCAPEELIQDPAASADEAELGESADALRSQGHTMTFTRCAGEGETCATTMHYVRYGAGDQFVYKSELGPFLCSAATFGSDPAPGVEKACYYSAYQPAFVGGLLPMTEGQTGNVIGNVAYGANGVFNFKTFPGTTFTSITCDDATFGDPLPGVTKGCFYLGVYRPFAKQGERITEVPRAVAYGANGRFTFKLVTEPQRCNDAGFGGDPFPGVKKACYRTEPFRALEGEALPAWGTYWYGSARNGNFIMRRQSPGALCASENFLNADPDPGAPKLCFGMLDNAP